MRSVKLFEFIHFDGDTFQVIARDGAWLALHSTTNSLVRHVSEQTLLSDDSYEPVDLVSQPLLDDAAIFDRMDADEREEVMWLHRHVYEVINGVPPLFGFKEGVVVPKSEYSADRLMKERISAKVAELKEAGHPMSARTLQRKVTAYRKQGVQGLRDRRRAPVRFAGEQQDVRLIELIKQELIRQVDTSTGTRSRLITRVTVAAEDAGIPLPSRSTLYRLVDSLEKGTHAFGDATLRRTMKNRPTRTFNRRNPMRPGEMVEIDSTKLDLMVVYPDGSNGRPELTSMIDVATRTVSAAVLFAESTTGVDVAALVLARSLTPLPMQPGWSRELSLSRSVLPVGMIESDAALHEMIAARPLIYPETITIDRGLVYTGSTFQEACERLEISLIPAPPGTPTDKPHIERQFKSVHEGLIQYLHGYVGRSVNRRGADPSKEAYWTLEQVQSILDQWLVQHWQNTPKPGLILPSMPKKALTPNEMYAALSEVSPTVAVQFSRDDYISLMKREFRTIQAYGINYGGLTYDNPALHPYRGKPSGLRGAAKDKWEVRVDPARMNTIFVRDHIEERWIEAAWHLDNKVLAPFSDKVFEAARRAVARRDETTPQLDVLKEIIRIQSGLDLTGTEKSAARRRDTPTVPPTLEAVADDVPAAEPDIADGPNPLPAQQPSKPERLRFDDLPEPLI